MKEIAKIGGFASPSRLANSSLREEVSNQKPTMMCCWAIRYPIFEGKWKVEMKLRDGLHQLVWRGCVGAGLDKRWGLLWCGAVEICERASERTSVPEEKRPETIVKVKYSPSSSLLLPALSLRLDLQSVQNRKASLSSLLQEQRTGWTQTRTFHSHYGPRKPTPLRGRTYPFETSFDLCAPASSYCRCSDATNCKAREITPPLVPLVQPLPLDELNETCGSFVVVREPREERDRERETTTKKVGGNRTSPCCPAIRQTTTGGWRKIVSPPACLQLAGAPDTTGHRGSSSRDSSSAVLQSGARKSRGKEKIHLLSVVPRSPAIALQICGASCLRNHAS
ncbi:hypothetical protein QBC32DRAFT_131204 [Pseudoneurospora amorphoporcata]|uniref:Uncharacterized protein n=1 Tax=Pseudoneurospora amorphoporcata TaxID=241081 RepID=A0AAN6NW20_9PEZI|nr:hypothetical protein QBC32DRAFT_131204 [Pseudoneurospora amorphoporcata]